MAGLDGAERFDESFEPQRTDQGRLFGECAEAPERPVFWPHSASAAREDLEGVPDAPEPSFEVSFFRNVTDTQPRPEFLPWSKLRERLTRHLRVRDKRQAPCFSPVRYRPGASRGSDGVEAVTLAVMDFDHDCDIERLRAFLRLKELAYILYSTFNHTQDAPRLRAVVPLSRPVPAERWRDTACRLHAFFAQSGCIPDPACTDPARLFYLPSAPPGAPVLADARDGRHLDPEELEPREVVDAGAGSRPGDEYNARGDVLSLLESRGWTVHERRGPGGTVYLTRPGKQARDGISATFDRDGRRTLYVFSSNAPPFEAGRGYTPFTVYALLEHGGDFASAARALASEGYGEPAGRARTATEAPLDVAAPAGPPGERITAHRDTLKELLAGSVRWCPEWKSWLRWNGVCWQRCQDEVIEAEAYESLRLRFLRIAETAADKQERAWAATRLHEVESGRYYREALGLLKGTDGFLMLSMEFDGDPNLLNTPAGVVDLRTGELRPARPEDLMTKTTGVPYDPQADCPEFLEFLKEVLPQEGLPEFLQLVFGVGLLGQNRFHKGFIFYGSGANGKSTLLKVIMSVAGDYARAIPRDTVLVRRQQQDAARVALAACEGLRLGVLEELADGAVLSGSALKDLVSNNEVKVRGLYEGYRETVIGLTLVIATNRKPAIPENTEGVWRRLALVPFTVTVPEERRDPEKADKLLQEAPGILRWMVEGARLALQRGHLELPDAVRDATEEYRTEEDVLAGFLDDCCTFGPRCNVPCGELYRAYQDWCNENTGGRALSQKAFGQALRGRGVTDTHAYRDGKRVRLYVGVGLRTDKVPDSPTGTNGTDSPPFSETFSTHIRGGDFSKTGLNPFHPFHPAEQDATNCDGGPCC